MGLEPLHLHAKRKAAQCRIRIRDHVEETWDGIGDNINRIGHARRLDRFVSGVCPRIYPIDHMTRKRVWVDNEVVDDPEITLFTDGSLLDGAAGSGWAMCCGDTVIAEEYVNLGDKASVFQAEVTAIHRGLQWVQDNCTEPATLRVLSDSQAAINAIFAVNTESKVVNDCKRVLKQSKENHRIGIEWIKGHADHTGNELADMLAKKGSDVQTHSCDPNLPIPMCYIKTGLENLCDVQWQAEWNGEDRCRQTKLFFPTVARKTSKLTSVYSKHDLNLLVQAGTGHALVAHHLSQWLDLVDECKLCLEDYETTSHLFFECPVLRSAREEITSFGTTEKRMISFFNRKVLRDLFTERSNLCQGEPA